MLGGSDAFSNGDTKNTILLDELRYNMKLKGLRARVNANRSEKFSNLAGMLGLVDHLRQTTDKHPPSLLVFDHGVEMVQSPGGTLLDAFAGPAGGIIIVIDIVIAGSGVPVTPSLESVIGLAVEAAIALFLGFAWTDFDKAPVDFGT